MFWFAFYKYEMNMFLSMCRWNECNLTDGNICQMHVVIRYKIAILNIMQQFDRIKPSLTCLLSFIAVNNL